LRPLRLTYQESLPDYESKKGEYDAQIQLIDNSITSITDVTIYKKKERNKERKEYIGRMNKKKKLEKEKINELID